MDMNLILVKAYSGYNDSITGYILRCFPTEAGLLLAHQLMIMHSVGARGVTIDYSFLAAARGMQKHGSP